MFSKWLSAAAVAALAQQVTAHTHLSQLEVIGDDGIYMGEYGYPRNFIAQGDAGYLQKWNYALVPPDDRAAAPVAGVGRRVWVDDLACNVNQQVAKQAEKYPRLKAAPGNFVAMKYTENGHTTHPDKGLAGVKPDPSDGTVYIYGTYEPKQGEKLSDVLLWTADGTGGDGRGKLLSAQDYDDNRCYQMNEQPESKARREITGQQQELLCESDLPIPKDAQVGKALTIYWVWDWPTIVGNDVKDEYYVHCLDIDIVDTVPIVQVRTATVPQQDINTKAVSTWQARTALSNTPRPVTWASGYKPVAIQASTPAPAPAVPSAAPIAPSAAPAPVPAPAITSAPAPAPAPVNGGQNGAADDAFVTVTIKETVFVTGPAPAAAPTPSAGALIAGPNGAAQAAQRLRFFRG